MAVMYNRGSGGDSLTVNNDYIFDTTTDRDTYFTSNSDELEDELYSVADGTLYKYDESTSTWNDVSTIIQGDTGATGAAGEDGEDGIDGDSVSLQYSDDNNLFHETLVADSDKYFRVVTTDSEGTSTYSDGVQFMGDDGTSFYPRYSEDGIDFHDTFDPSVDTYLMIVTVSSSGIETSSEAVKFVGDDASDFMIQYSSAGDSSWHDDKVDSDLYWRWSTDGGDTWSGDFVRFKTDVDVNIATVDETGVVKPDGTSITITDDGTISATAAAATKVAVADETEMLALTQIDNLYIVTRTDLSEIWYLNASLDPSVLTNWEEGASVADTVSSWKGAGDDTAQIGDVIASNTDYTMDMIRGEDITNTGTQYYLEIDNGVLYMVEV